jgi:transposase
MQMAKTTSAEWAKRVERWQDSGLTAKEFAAELNVNAGTLAYWKYRLRRESASGGRADRPGIRKAESTAGFLRVVPVAAADAESTNRFEVVISDRTVVRVPNDFDEPALIRLVRALGGF